MPLTLIDFYKADHRSQYPDGTELVFSNWTARGSRVVGTNEVIFFGLQYYLKKYLIKMWQEDFFDKPKDEVVKKYKRRMVNAGLDITYEHIEDLHDLGYIPMEFWALPEGTRVPTGIPMFVVWNTNPEFFWLTNYLETSISTTIWGMCTSATLADKYKKIIDWAMKFSGGAPEFIQWQSHDFSCRGMFGIEAGHMSGAAHLLSGTGTDTVGAIDFLEEWYNADSDAELVGGSIPATEHSVMCMGEKSGEFETFRRLICDVYPTGNVSIVSDTWDLWQVVNDFMPRLKEEIMARDGCVVIRPDSGDPVNIICGEEWHKDAESSTGKGLWKRLYEIFGGTVNEKGYKQLDPHVGAIYGDSITPERCAEICERLLANKFVPSVVFGVGSFTYQYNTRDTFNFAIKATYGEVNGEPREIFKDPATGDGSKKSARGLLAVKRQTNGTLYLIQQTDWDTVKNCAFKKVFSDGTLVRDQSLSGIRNLIKT